MLVDSHCHLNLLDLKHYDNSQEALLKAAMEEGVEHFLCVGVDLATASEVIKLAEQFSCVSASVGVHPSEEPEQEIADVELLHWAENPQVVAIGETGLDYYYNKTGLEQQREKFRQHIRVAKQCSKPLIIHSRSAHQDTIQIMRSEDAQSVSGVMHCFTESWEMAKEALDLGFYISFSGIITFKNAAELVEVVKLTPLSQMLIETDSPYLAPVPHRGKSNEPKYVRYVAEKIAELKQLTLAEVAEQTTNNFYQLFGEHLRKS